MLYSTSRDVRCPPQEYPTRLMQELSLCWSLQASKQQASAICPSVTLRHQVIQYSDDHQIIRQSLQRVRDRGHSYLIHDYRAEKQYPPLLKDVAVRLDQQVRRRVIFLLAPVALQVLRFLHRGALRMLPLGQKRYGDAATPQRCRQEFCKAKQKWVITPSSSPWQGLSAHQHH